MDLVIWIICYSMLAKTRMQICIYSFFSIIFSRSKHSIVETVVEKRMIRQDSYVTSTCKCIIGYQQIAFWNNIQVLSGRNVCFHLWLHNNGQATSLCDHAWLHQCQFLPGNRIRKCQICMILNYGYVDALSGTIHQF